MTTLHLPVRALEPARTPAAPEAATPPTTPRKPPAVSLEAWKGMSWRDREDFITGSGLFSRSLGRRLLHAYGKLEEAEKPPTKSAASACIGDGRVTIVVGNCATCPHAPAAEKSAG